MVILEIENAEETGKLKKYWSAIKDAAVKGGYTKTHYLFSPKFEWDKRYGIPLLFKLSIPI